MLAKNTNSSTIATVVVTYNRGELLIKCLKAIMNQTLLPNEVFIIDNHSNDDTQQLLYENGYIGHGETIINEFGESQSIMYKNTSVKLTYLYKTVNDGGAGGFYAGMKSAYDAGYKWIWMMDDDGVPDINELSELLTISERNNLLYTNALVIDIDDKSELAFGLGGTLGMSVNNYTELDIYAGAINPFNGTFINRKIIDKIGLIKRELFIWGDENEYTNRVKHYGFRIATICSAKHYHPKKLVEYKRIIPFINKGKCSIHKPIYYRNYGYINWKYNKHEFFRSLIFRTLYYGCRFQISNLINLYRYTIRGVKEKWDYISIK